MKDKGSSRASPSQPVAARRGSIEGPAPSALPGRWAVEKYLAKGPWALDPHIGWIWAPSLKGGDTHVGTVEMRGWGYLTGGGHGALGLTGEEGAKAQDAIGEFILAAVNLALSTTPASPESLSVSPDAQKDSPSTLQKGGEGTGSSVAESGGTALPKSDSLEGH